MRARIYGSLAALTAVLAFVIIVGETREGALTGWDVAGALVGFAAMIGIAIIALVALVYELRAWRQRRAARA